MCWLWSSILEDLFWIHVLHKAKQKAASDRIKDSVNQGKKVVVFTCFSEGIERHKKQFGGAAVIITGPQSVAERMDAADAFQNDPKINVCLCNIIAGGLGITLTAGTHVLFQDLDWWTQCSETSCPKHIFLHQHMTSRN